MFYHEADPEGDKLVYTILTVIAFFTVGCLAGGITLAVLHMDIQDFDSGVLFMNDQFTCVIPKDAGAPKLFIRFNASEVEATTSYVFINEPKRVDFTNELPVFKIKDATSSSFSIPSANSSVVSFRLDVDSSVGLQLIGDKKTVIYEKKGVRIYEGEIKVDRKYDDPRFVIKGDKKHSGTLAVNVTSPRYDIQSTDFTWMCDQYPCECDLTDHNVHEKKLWVVTVNNGSQIYEIDHKLEGLFVTLFFMMFAVLCYFTSSFSLFFSICKQECWKSCWLSCSFRLLYTFWWLLRFC